MVDPSFSAKGKPTTKVVGFFMYWNGLNLLGLKAVK